MPSKYKCHWGHWTCDDCDVMTIMVNTIVMIMNYMTMMIMLTEDKKLEGDSSCSLEGISAPTILHANSAECAEVELANKCINHFLTAGVRITPRTPSRDPVTHLSSCNSNSFLLSPCGESEIINLIASLHIDSAPGVWRRSRCGHYKVIKEAAP